MNNAGQLGNHLFQFAHALAISKEHSVQVHNFAFSKYATFFDNKALSAPRFTVYRYPLFQKLNKRHSRWLKATPEAPIFLDTLPLAESIRSHRYTFLSGFNFFLSPGYAKFKDEIRATFTPRKDLALEVENLLIRTRAEADIVVGIHIRQFDPLRDGLERPGFPYRYEDGQLAVLAMRRLHELLFPKRVHFVLCSNRPLKTELFNGFHYTLGMKNLVSDLHLLSKCDLLMGTPSTFGRWASFAGNTPRYKYDHNPESFNLSDFKVDSYLNNDQDL